MGIEKTVENKLMDLGLLGVDIGNAKTEIAFYSNENTNKKGDSIVYKRQPSVIAQLVKKPEVTEEDPRSLMNNLLDHLTVHITSHAIRRDGIYYVGKKALEYDRQIDNMSINLGGKSSHDIPVIMSLSMIAALGVTEEFNSTNVIPNSLHLTFDMATAIPSSEYTKNNAKLLEDRFLGEKNNPSHIVNLYIGDQTVTVTITIRNCKVTEEGKTAMLAFLSSSNEILTKYNEQYRSKEGKTQATPEDFKNASVVHADIGDGTSEFVHTKGTNPVASFGEKIGVGHATEGAIELYTESLSGQVVDMTRQHFMALTKEKTEKGKLAKRSLEKATFIQADSILENTKKCFTVTAKTSADFFFIHGGGSVVFEKDLYNQLVKYAESVKCEVVWIPEEYCSHLNSRGTLILCKLLFNK